MIESGIGNSNDEFNKNLDISKQSIKSGTIKKIEKDRTI